MNLDEFVSVYLACCTDRTVSNEDIAQAYIEATCDPMMTDEDFEMEVRRILPQLPYYTGKEQ